MDDFNRELLKAAYKACKKRRKGKPTVTAVDLRHEMWSHWRDVRDYTITRWADRIVERVPRTRLVAKVETVFDLVEKAGIHWWEWPHNEDEAVYAVAWGLATLRWVNQERAERAPVPRCTDDEIENWIAVREPRQLSLF